MTLPMSRQARFSRELQRRCRKPPSYSSSATAHELPNGICVYSIVASLHARCLKETNPVNRANIKPPDAPHYQTLSTPFPYRGPVHGKEVTSPPPLQSPSVPASPSPPLRQRPLAAHTPSCPCRRQSPCSRSRPQSACADTQLSPRYRFCESCGLRRGSSRRRDGLRPARGAGCRSLLRGLCCSGI